MPVPGVKKKYFIFQEGNDIMFVNNVPPEEIDDAVIRAFKSEVASRGLDRIIFPNVEELILNASQGEVVRIGGLLKNQSEEMETFVIEEEKIRLEDIPFQIIVSHDGMQALLEMTNPSDGITRTHIDMALEYNGVRFGIIEENIERVLNEWPRIFKIVIAVGTTPVDGNDAYLSMTKDFKNNLAPEITQDGVVNFKELNLIAPIVEGEVVQIRVPPTPGTPGHDIFGHAIPATPGKNVSFIRGQNTEIRENGTQLVAAKEGFLHIGSRGDINVRPVYTVNGDVDYSTGNIKYKSDVLVKGDVRSGFTVKAGGDVHVYGALEDSVIEAGGNVIIKGGVLSSGTALVKADGDVSIGFIQNGTIEAGGSVYIRNEAISAKISAGRDIEVTKREGRIVGGDIQVGGWVVAEVIGSDNCPPLKIKFKGLPADRETLNGPFEFCFLSTKYLASPVKVMFGSMVADVSGVTPPVTISLKEGRIQIEKIFFNQNDLKKRRKERELPD